MSGKPPQPSSSRGLPEQPNLEQLRKQAKELLEGYRSGDPAAVAEVQRFERAPDPASFALHDAQRVLARAYGYESWFKLKAFVDKVNVASLAEAVQAGDLAQVRKLLHARPELIGMDVSANDEHRALHYAVLRRDPAMVRLLMEAGADARKGIFPHRDATSAFAIARDREYHEIVAIIEEEERARREELSCPNATVSPVQEEISAAISRGDAARAVSLLEADRSLIQACDRNGATPLHIAAQEGNTELVTWLLERRANARKQDVQGLTALDRAAMAVNFWNSRAQQFPAIAKALLQRGAEMTIRGAVALGDVTKVRELVSGDLGVLRQITWRNGGLLTLAVKHGQLETARLLLDLGADVDERTMLEELEEPTLSWGSPLWHAALAGDREMAKLLLDRGADPNGNVYASGWPLRNAWGHHDDSVKRLLLERGAKVQPYMVAEMHDVDEARRLLDADPSEDVVHELVWSSADHGCPEILELALPRLSWRRDNPRWHWVLIQPIRGAGGNSPNRGGHVRCMELLLRHGIDPNVSRFGHTTLHYLAARDGVSDEDRVRFGSLLLDYGSRVDMRDDLLQSTPLGWACRWGRTGLVQLLVARGAPVDEPEAQPWARPKSWAEKMKHGAVLSVLQSSRTA
jgi:ankyrin repeat protein